MHKKSFKQLKIQLQNKFLNQSKGIPGAGGSSRLAALSYLVCKPTVLPNTNSLKALPRSCAKYGQY